MDQIDPETGAIIRRGPRRSPPIAMNREKSIYAPQYARICTASWTGIPPKKHGTAHATDRVSTPMEMS